MHQVRIRTAAVAVAVAVLAAATAGCSAAPRRVGQDQGRSMRSAPCDAAALSATLSGRDGAALPPAPAVEGAALLAVVFTNEGDRSCVLQGWPSIRLSAAGKPFGPVALRIRAVPEPAVTLRPGKRAQVSIALHSGLDSFDCDIVHPDALALTVPRTTRTLDVGLPTDYLGTACRSTHDTLIGVEAVLPL